MAETLHEHSEASGVSAYTRRLEELDGRALAEAGGKGANLGELIKAGLPGPPGFVVTASAYRALLDQHGLHERIVARLAGLPIAEMAAVADASREIAAWVEQAAVPAAIQADVARAYADLCERMAPAGEADLPVAVRSSATAEDLPGASFAGQQETFLHVCGAGAVLEHVRKCWASLWTPQAILYRASMGFDHLGVALAVVVQAMAPAEVAGVMFTANPVTGARDELLISASYGLGEAVVSGMVTPDTFVLAADGALRSRTLGDKERRVMPDGSGTRVEPVPDAERRRFCLNERDLRALAALARRVQAHYGSPQDTEWALSGGQIYLLQARPITTLAQADTIPNEPPINRKFSGVKQIGFVVGPALGGALSQISLAAPAYAAGTLSLLSAVVGFFVLPESLPVERRATARLGWAAANPFAPIVELMRRPALRPLLVTQCIFNFVAAGTNGITPVFLIEKFGVRPLSIAALLVVIGVANVVVQGGLVGRLAAVFGEQRLAISGLLFQALGAVCTAVVPLFWMLYPLSGLTSGGAGTFRPGLSALLSHNVPAEDQGKLNGVTTALASLMSVGGPLWAGATYDYITPGAPFWIGAALLALASLLLAATGAAPAQAPAARA